MSSWTVLGADKCGFCKDAIEALHKHKKEFVYVSLTEGGYMKTLVGMAGFRTVPIVFDPQGRLVGGYLDLVDLLEDEHGH